MISNLDVKVTKQDLEVHVCVCVCVCLKMNVC